MAMTKQVILKTRSLDPSGNPNYYPSFINTRGMFDYDNQPLNMSGHVHIPGT